jgi:hypothetical protein
MGGCVNWIFVFCVNSCKRHINVWNQIHTSFKFWWHDFYLFGKHSFLDLMKNHDSIHTENNIAYLCAGYCGL